MAQIVCKLFPDNTTHNNITMVNDVRMSCGKLNDGETGD